MEDRNVPNVEWRFGTPELKKDYKHEIEEFEEDVKSIGAGVHGGTKELAVSYCYFKELINVLVTETNRIGEVLLDRGTDVEIDELGIKICVRGGINPTMLKIEYN